MLNLKLATLVTLFSTALAATVCPTCTTCAIGVFSIYGSGTCETAAGATKHQYAVYNNVCVNTNQFTAYQAFLTQPPAGKTCTVYVYGAAQCAGGSSSYIIPSGDVGLTCQIFTSPTPGAVLGLSGKVVCV